MRLVDRPELADFVSSMTSATRHRRLTARAADQDRKLDAERDTPDVTVALTADAAAPDYPLYVHSARFTHLDAAALLAAIWKTDERAKLAARDVR